MSIYLYISYTPTPHTPTRLHKKKRSYGSIREREERVMIGREEGWKGETGRSGMKYRGGGEARQGKATQHCPTLSLTLVSPFR